MPKTYYDSELTGAQIESALNAIHGVVTPSNNGKVLCIVNGAIVAKSASEWGQGAVLEPLSVTANGDYTPPSGVDGFSEAHVAVPSYPEPTGTIQITQNGTVNVKDYASAEVNVSGGGGAVVQPLSVTQNGTYNPPSGVDGYAPVTVNVSGGEPDTRTLIANWDFTSDDPLIDTIGGKVMNKSDSVAISSNGAYFPESSNGSGYRASNGLWCSLDSNLYGLDLEVTLNGVWNIKANTPSSHARFLCGSLGIGFIFRSNSGLSAYNGTWASSALNMCDYMKYNQDVIVRARIADNSSEKDLFMVNNVVIYRPSVSSFGGNSSFIIGVPNNASDTAIGGITISSARIYRR